MPVGALIGDFVGSRFERHNITTPAFQWVTPQSRLTDDSVLTLATCEALLTSLDYRAAYRSMVRRFPGVGYSPGFQAWALASDDLGTRASSGCGASIRVSPIGWALGSLDAVLEEAERSARATHDHDEAVMGAQAIAGGVFLLRQGASVGEVVDHAAALGLDTRRTIADWRALPGWSAETRRTVPVALAALREGDDFESVVRLAISAGGDSDSIAAMAGCMAQAHWSIPPALAMPALAALDRAPSLRAILDTFWRTFGLRDAGEFPGPTPQPEAP